MTEEISRKSIRMTARDYVFRLQFREKYFRRIRIGAKSLFVLRTIPQHLEAFYELCQSGLEQELRRKGGARFEEVFLCFSKHAARLPRRGRVIVVQHEHAILDASHPQDDAVASPLRFGTPPSAYLVRTFGPPEGFESAAKIIEYSEANISHVMNSTRAHFYRGKCVRIAPLLGVESRNTRPRNEPQVCTMFGSPGSGRRAALIDALDTRGVATRNILEFKDFRTAFYDCAILVNYRQFCHFQTLEELRVIPALLQRVVVVTEPFPYAEQTQLSPFLITAPTDRFSDVVKEVRDNYLEIWNSIFEGPDFDAFEAQMKRRNEIAFQKLLSNRLSGP